MCATNCCNAHVSVKYSTQCFVVTAWCKRTDELVDGPNAFCVSPAALDRWEERLQDIFNGHPNDILDAALTDTVSKFNLHIKVLQNFDFRNGFLFYFLKFFFGFRLMSINLM